MELELKKQLVSIANSLRMIAYSMATYNQHTFEKCDDAYRVAARFWDDFLKATNGKTFDRDEYLSYMSCFGDGSLDIYNKYFEDMLSNEEIYETDIPGIYCSTNNNKE